VQITTKYDVDAAQPMPKRPRSHELEDMSVNQLHRVFEGAGWTVEEISKDYGEDLLVRIFERHKATQLKFFVQAKATDHITRYLDRRGGVLNVPVKAEHAEQWGGFHEPVILTIWDSRLGNTYWICVQDALAKRAQVGDSRSSKTLRIPIPCENVLNSEGLRRLCAFIRARHKRLARERQGAEVLREFLAARMGFEIEYSPERGIVFLGKPGKGTDVFFFGATSNQLLAVAGKLKKSPKQALLAAIKNLSRDIEEHEQSGKFRVMSSRTGKIESRRMTQEQLRSHLLKELERLDQEAVD
jgi:hypothetical protein